jgi:hypothetical protein
MTKEEVLNALRDLDREQERRWLTDFGGLLTISARSGYPVGAESGRIEHLMAFNEMQHQLYGRLRHLDTGEPWDLEEFLNGLQRIAEYRHVEGDFGWALATSVRRLTQTHA